MAILNLKLLTQLKDVILNSNSLFENSSHRFKSRYCREDFILPNLPTNIFSKIFLPGETCKCSGIYVCIHCGSEMTIAKGSKFPSQNTKQRIDSSEQLELELEELAQYSNNSKPAQYSKNLKYKIHLKNKEHQNTPVEWMLFIATDSLNSL